MILTCYFDESGTHDDSPVTIVAGVIGTSAQWLEYQKQLNRLKLAYGFKVLHAKKFKSKSGEFAGWSDEKCVAFVNDFFTCGSKVMRMASCSITNAQFDSQYRTADTPRKLRLDTKYGLCFRNTLTYLVSEVFRRLGAHKNFGKTSLHVVMESGHKNAGDAQRIFEELKSEIEGSGSNLLRSITFAGKNDDADPLMMADMLSHTVLMIERNGGHQEPEAVQGRSKTPDVAYLSYDSDGLAELKKDLLAKFQAKRDRLSSGASLATSGGHA